MKTLALLCVVGLVAASDALSGRIAIYGELTLQRLVTGTLTAWSRVVNCRCVVLSYRFGVISLYLLLFLFLVVAA